MNEQELTDSLRRMLHRRAADLRPGPGSPPLQGEMPGPYRLEVHPRRPPAPVIVAAAAAAVLVAGVVGLAFSGHHHSTVATGIGTTAAVGGASAPTVTSVPSAPLPATTVAPSTVEAPTTVAAAATVAAGFAPLSVSFVSADQGWTLGQAPCPTGRCAAVARTTDGGVTWTPAPAPQLKMQATGSSPVTIRFADAADGWLYTSGSLWVTHAGGATWRPEAVPGGPGGQIADLEASAGVAYLVVLRPGTGETIYSAPVTDDTWAASPLNPGIGAGPVPSAQMVLQGPAGWIMTVNRTPVSGARRTGGGGWQGWTPPCTHSNGAGGLAAASTTDVVAWCAEGAWGPPDPGRARGQVSVWRSSDGGSTFSPVGTVPGAVIGSLAVAPGQPADILAITSKGLFRSTDGGLDWSPVYPGSTANADGPQYVGFTTATQAVAVVDTGSGPSLIISRDGGGSWSPATF